VLILILPIVSIMNYFNTPPRYPFTTNRLPEGIVTFLNKIPAEGKVMNHPNFGGYLQWKLYPQYKILMDMQVPFLFKDEDFFSAVFSYANPEALSRIIKQYDPTFIVAYNNDGDFWLNIRKYPQFKLIFFDHVATLFMREDRYPEIVKKYEIKHVSPFESIGNNIASLVTKDNKDGFTGDLSKILAVYPECFIANELMALLYLKDGENRKVLQYAEVITKHFPESATGYRLKGDSLKGLNLYDEAIQYYNRALDRTEESERSDLYKRIGYAYVAKHDYQRAYLFLKKGINVFSSRTTYKEIWDLSTAALLSDKFDEAYSLTLFLRQIIPTGDVEYNKRVRERLEHFTDPI
jgi:tetratricopeptide (TPR) repeat protein